MWYYLFLSELGVTMVLWYAISKPLLKILFNGSNIRSKIDNAFVALMKMLDTESVDKDMFNQSRPRVIKNSS